MGKKVIQRVQGYKKIDSDYTADGDCSHEIKRHLLLGRKVMTKLDRKSTRLNSSHRHTSRMPSSA